MKVVSVHNVNLALPRMMRMLRSEAITRESRAGPVLEMPCPVTTVYMKPTQRVLFAAERDANPFFHLFESLWMLEGRNDIAFPAYYNRRMMDYSDDGLIQHGAYGHRWRNHFDKDQILCAINLLKNKPKSRRAVIQMYDPRTDVDISETMKDVPCNLTIALLLDDTGMNTRLDMTVFCRSNDAIWGAAGANAVHFSILQEYIAEKLGVRVGLLYQISNNLHAYKNIYDELNGKGLLNRTTKDPYMMDETLVADLIVSDADAFDDELTDFLHCVERSEDFGSRDGWKNKFFPDVAVPMAQAFKVFREWDKSTRKYEEMLSLLCDNLWIEPYKSDWLTAARLWTERRLNAYLDSQLEGMEEAES